MKTIKPLLYILLLFNTSSVFSEQMAADVPHELFQRVISQHVDNGVVDYPAIGKNSDYQNYLVSLKPAVKFQSTNQALSYWINAYNALAIQGILDGRSPSSFFGKIGYFYNAEYTVNGLTINLYNLEHDYILTLGEPRVHFALNCASASCPILESNIYRKEILEQQLEQVAIKFINDTSRNRFDYQTKTAYLSKIFDWFEDDFAKHSGTVQNYLALYISDAKISNALANNEFTIEYLEYDWSLNGIDPNH